MKRGHHKMPSGRSMPDSVMKKKMKNPAMPKRGKKKKGY